MLCKSETACAFVDVADKFCVIDEETVTVMADPVLIYRIESGELVTPNDLQRGSVSVRQELLKKLKPQPVRNYTELLRLSAAQYDSFLGYMKELCI